ncbi:MAG TPA: PEP-CTERM sorting domain-containing protein [Tepidisphaeraceae bacterium]|nr:PEP-CTERM sorting domain-containing protein [Tepidisphaeraceae bacterium]
MRYGKFIAFIVAAGLVAPAFGALQQVTDNFNSNTDSYWDGVGNRTSPQNFGWSNSDNTGNSVNPPSGTATGGGEMGGQITRNGNIQAYYAFNVGSVTSSDVLSASGVYQYVSGSGGINIGWFLGATSTGSGGDDRNFIGISLDDGKNVYTHASTGSGDYREQASDIPTLTAGVTYPFSIVFDPAANGGQGTITATFGNSTHVENIQSGVIGSIPALDHFGLFPVGSSAVHTVTAYMDDLTFTSANPLPAPEPASLGMLSAGAILLSRRRRC